MQIISRSKRGMPAIGTISPRLSAPRSIPHQCQSLHQKRVNVSYQKHQVSCVHGMASTIYTSAIVFPICFQHVRSFKLTYLFYNVRPRMAFPCSSQNQERPSAATQVDIPQLSYDCSHICTNKHLYMNKFL